MPINNRDLPPGTTLTAKFKKQDFSCEVIQLDDGKLAFRHAGKDYSSPSAAGSAVMGGTACNGWRFWSVAGEDAPKREMPAKAEAPAPKAKTRKPAAKKRVRQIKPLRIQAGAPEGMTRWFCSACMEGFEHPAGETPETCPKGHAREVDDDLAPPDELAAAAAK